MDDFTTSDNTQEEETKVISIRNYQSFNLLQEHMAMADKIFNIIKDLGNAERTNLLMYMAMTEWCVCTDPVLDKKLKERIGKTIYDIRKLANVKADELQ